ncbi:MAG: hypothetical protein FWG75_00540 [Cystobacterineae bacterium]|nr:hypothetical protein [Cystobacterineae bacterium]
MKAQKLGPVVAFVLWASACHMGGLCTIGHEAGACPPYASCFAGQNPKVGDRGICVYNEPVISSFSPLEAAHGATLVIYGEKFNALNKVSLNGVDAEILSATDTEIAVRVPKNMHCSGLIEITAGDKTVLSTTPFTYVPTAFVSTFAGSGKQDFANGQGSEAAFSWPVGLAIGAEGKLFVADHNNYGIREISPEGHVELFVGLNTADTPLDIAVDLQNNLYVVNSSRHLIQKITPTGEVSTFAGGTQGFADGQGSSARFNFNNSGGITIDAAGNLFVADTDNHRIRQITPEGEVSTFAGSGIAGSIDGEAALAEFDSPGGIAIDLTGNLWVADAGNHRIRKITPEGEVSTLAGSTQGFANGRGSNARFSSPWGIAIDMAGNLFVADADNHRIRKITPEGVVSTFAGSGISGLLDGGPTLARFDLPAGLTMDMEGNLYVADSFNHCIRKIILE